MGDEGRIPPALEGLERLAYNMYWSWHREVRSLFARIDRDVWAEWRSPVAVLRHSRDWTSLLEDPDFMVQYQTILDAGGEVTDAVRAAAAAEQSARERLPSDTRALIVIMNDVAQGGLNQAVISIEETRGALAAELDVQRALQEGTTLPE